MREKWRVIDSFPDYSVSDYGRIRADRSGRLLALNRNQSGLLQVGLMDGNIQRHRSVPRLVAKAFIPQPSEAFDTPINLDGDRLNNHVDNLVWRPRWFAIRYARQFKYRTDLPILSPVQNLTTGEISENSLSCAKRYGLLEQDLVFSILNNTYVWPIYQQFRVLAD